MAFTAITSAQILAGEPTAQELFSKVKDNFDDHESRLTVVETIANVSAPIRFGVANYLNSLPATEVDVERIPYDLLILSARILVLDGGSAGTLEVDLEYKRGANPWTSIFSALPSVPFSAGDYALSSNGVLGSPNLLLGDLLRLNINSGQTGNTKFLVLVEYERT